MKSNLVTNIIWEKASPCVKCIVYSMFVLVMEYIRGSGAQVDKHLFQSEDVYF